MHNNIMYIVCILLWHYTPFVEEASMGGGTEKGARRPVANIIFIQTRTKRIGPRTTQIP